LWRIVNSHAFRLVPGSNWCDERNAFRYVSWTRSSASAARRVRRSAVPYRLSMCDSAASANPFASRPAGGRRNAIGENTGGCRFIPSLYRAEDTGRCPAGTAFGAISPFPRPSDLVRRHVACCGPPLGPRARDVGVAANVLLTVTSAPFEVDTCVRAPGAVYERRSGSPFSW